MKFAQIPAEMRVLNQWVNYRLVRRNGRATKMPIQPNGRPASSTDPKTWNSFAHVCDFESCDGIGFVFTKEDPFVGIDIDKCRNSATGETELWATELLNELDSYTELSQSHCGYHVIVRGSLDSGPNRRGRVEMYSSLRFFVMTGEVAFGQNSIKFRDLKTIQDRLSSGLLCQNRKVLGPHDESAEDYRLVAEMHRALGTSNGGLIEDEFRQKHLKRYELRNHIKGVHAGKNYIRYTVDRYLENFARSHRANASDPSDGSIQSQTETLIEDMPEAALTGRLGEIFTNRLAPLGIPRSFGWTALLAAGGALVPPSEIRTNLNSAQVGPVGCGKSTTVSYVVELMGLREPILQRIMAGSAEGLFSRLEGAKGAPRLVWVDELGHLLEKSKIENASFPYVLSRAFNDSKFTLTIARGAQVEVWCSLSYIGSVVFENFGRLFDFTTMGGLHDRFIFGLCPQPWTFDYRPLTGTAESFKPLAVEIDPPVWDHKREWSREFRGESSRVVEHALRAAVICASLDGRKILRWQDLESAKVFADYQSRVRRILRPNPGENQDAKCAFAVISHLQDRYHDGVWAVKRNLYKAIHGERFGPGVFDRAIANLECNEQIKTSKQGKQKLVGLLD